MVKANEVRLGNKVFGHNTIWTIDETDFSKIDSDTGELPYNPIPLTEEWLVNFGFDRKDGKLCEYSFRANDFEYWVSFIKPLSEVHSVGIFQDKDAPMMNFVWRIKYVHSIQNLYFALTGEELKIKE